MPSAYDTLKDNVNRNTELNGSHYKVSSDTAVVVNAIHLAAIAICDTITIVGYNIESVIRQQGGK